jgi:predicted Zn-dependent protease
VRGSRDVALFDLVLIAHAGHVYRLTGVCADAEAATYRPVFLEIARSFRPLTQTQRAGIQELRLRVVSAREGETLERFAARAGSAWTPDELAVANALETSERLRKGQLVKVPIRQRYTPRPAAAR